MKSGWTDDKGRDGAGLSPWAWLATGTLALLMGCGGGGDKVTDPPVTTPPAPVRSIVAEGRFTLDAPDDQGSYFMSRVFTTTVPGTLDTTVDWTFATNRLFMYIAEGDCTVEQFASDDCPGPACACRFSATSEQAAPKPRVLTVPNASAGTRTLIVWNLGPREESGSYQAVTITAGGSARAATAVRGRGVKIAHKRTRDRAVGAATSVPPAR